MYVCVPMSKCVFVSVCVCVCVCVYVNPMENKSFFTMRGFQ